MLRFVLGDEDHVAGRGLLPHARRHLRDDVLVGRIEDALRGVEPQAVEVELANPVRGVLDHELPHRTGVGPVEVDGVTPLVGVPVGEVRRRERLQVVAVRAEVVVDDVENHAEPERVRAVDEPPQIVRPPVGAGGREEIDAVVAPAETAGELGDRHHLDAGDAQRLQPRQLACGRRPGALGREGADVQLVEHLSAAG